MLDNRLAFDGVPARFRGWCAEACRGGAYSYAMVGKGLAKSLETEIPNRAEADEWAAELKKLNDLVRANNRDAVEQWLAAHFPLCMQLVPRRSRPTFVAGVFSVFEEAAIAPGQEVVNL